MFFVKIWNVICHLIIIIVYRIRSFWLKNFIWPLHILHKMNRGMNSIHSMNLKAVWLWQNIKMSHESWTPVSANIRKGKARKWESESHPSLAVASLTPSRSTASSGLLWTTQVRPPVSESLGGWKLTTITQISFHRELICFENPFRNKQVSRTRTPAAMKAETPDAMMRQL